MNYRIIYSDHLEHHGIKGQKWGVRRFQNKDGTWTDEGKKRRQKSSGGSTSGHKEWSYGGTTDYKISKGNAKGRKMLDDLASTDDIYEAGRKFDIAVQDALEIHKNKGSDAAFSYIGSKLKDYDYEIAINKDPDDYGDEKYWHYTYNLTVFGNKYAYNSSGEPDYSDEEQFMPIEETTKYTPYWRR